MEFKSLLEDLRFHKKKSLEEKLESLSFLLIVVSAVFSVVGISVGTFISGIPVLLAIIGAFLVVLGIVIYIISEFVRGLG